ncbi:MAG: hypothetical protein QOE14_2235 [Humisphaera sp.]|nr:hypothetical protein [Humisphaera sp.]
MTRVSAPPLLSYATPGETRRRPGALGIVQLVLALPALVVPFVPFTYGTSPLDVVSDLPDDLNVFSISGDYGLFLIGWSFFAAFPITAWKVRQLVRATPPGVWERGVLGTLAVLLTIPATIVIVSMVRSVVDEALAPQPSRPGLQEIVMIATGMAPLAAGIGLTLWRWLRRRTSVAAIETLLVTGYLTNAAICLLGFFDNPQLGYWLTIPPTAAFALDLLRPRLHRA